VLQFGEFGIKNEGGGAGLRGISGQGLRNGKGEAVREKWGGELR